MFFAINSLEAIDFRQKIEIVLKKDQKKKILVKYADKEKLFEFRWTLYKNGGLVIHRAYDKIVGQNVLYLRDKNQSFRVELKTRDGDFYNLPYVLVKFKEFKQESKEAVFELFLWDKKEDIFLEELKNG
jgi:hypothetical protein